MRVTVITVSDRASAGVYEDLGGKEIESMLKGSLPGVQISRDIVPDRRRAIRRALRRAMGSDFIVTTGGTGISPRDVTPEVTRGFCRRELPGIAEILRAESYREVPSAMLSRGFAGTRGTTVVVNFPGSVNAVRLCSRVLLQVMEHATQMLKGEGH